jgi:hypothetical protein
VDSASADKLLQFVGPHAGGVDDLPGADVELPAALEVPRLDADHTLALAQEAGRAGAGGQQGAIVGGGAGDRQRVTGVVDLTVPVLDAADQRLAAQ